MCFCDSEIAILSFKSSNVDEKLKIIRKKVLPENL